MKKILFFLLLSCFAFGQLSKDSIQKIAQLHFETEFVQKRLKDPYSYELKKIWSIPISQEEYLHKLMYSRVELSNNKNFSRKERSEFSESAVNTRKQLDTLNQSEKNKITFYDVCFDIYAANNYGNKILGKYKLRVKTTGEIFGDIAERDN
ncbi:hypothetical protein BAZ12_00665 [Elizabethkingia miricola]|uniref:hypothetical protein n=1 Tax=Elizabethkingia TaxID=308865 RepID=UPI0008401822|nr:MULTISPECIES: hypothetical protein [Elizabethkingia]DAP61723.1 MAG TPA: hypothetical protein [Caudoviricetes sp.]MCL1652579.1 hypothetical protein [Elizabethkingia miricola]OCW73143.1 hypothetical protein A4G24_15825 [Elizabethkingia anophelis]OPC71126.1 hypothetical protein BAZ13_09765 [Elizabethkingia miricola]OPC75587.1 hypothetical protein BAZ12_00665 [Elizabethkingia miricola]